MMINSSKIASSKSEFKKDSKKIGWRTKRGDVYLLCPFHKEKTPSLVVHKRTEDYYICYGCGRCGDTKELRKMDIMPYVSPYSKDQLLFDFFDFPF